MGQLSNLRVVDPVLTNIVRGYSNEEFIGKYLFPFVDVDMSEGKIPAFGKEAFKVYDAKRALRANSNKIPPDTLSSVAYITEEYDMSYPIDYLESGEAVFNLEAHAAQRVSESLMLKHEKIVADLLQTYTNYASTNYTTLTTTQFNDTDAKPVTTIKTGMAALRSVIGKYPNTMVMGATVWENLMTNTGITDLIKYTGFGVVTIEILKQLTGIQNIYVGKSIYTADGSDTFTDIWGDNVVLAYVAPPKGVNQTPYEPSLGYTLRKKNYPQADTYEEQGGKIINVRATDNFQVKATGVNSSSEIISAYLIKDCIQ